MLMCIRKHFLHKVMTRSASKGGLGQHEITFFRDWERTLARVF